MRRTRPTIHINPLRDSQQEFPSGWCRLCRAELYGEERDLCPRCRREQEEYDV